MSDNLEREALLVLADGSVFQGVAFGYLGEGESESIAVGEVVFNTSLYGYQEILTDPSYAGQMITFTYPHIGNVGCNDVDFESDRVYAKGVIIRNYPKLSSSFRSEKTLCDFLKEQKVVGISNINTRKLVTHIRDIGSQMGVIGIGSVEDESLVAKLVAEAKSAGSMEGKDYVTHVTTKNVYPWKQSIYDINSASAKVYSERQLVGRPNVVAIDCGVKRSILSLLVNSGFRVTVVPATTTAEEIESLQPDALFLSNGPGDPATVTYVVDTVNHFLGRIPMFGICLGHQILSIALGGKTYKMKFGHRGGNHPVMDLTTKKVEITVQNHGFAVQKDSLPKNVNITHINLNDETVEGVSEPKLGVFSVQYHPESCPGPNDARYLFTRFFNWVVDPLSRV